MRSLVILAGLFLLVKGEIHHEIARGKPTRQSTSRPDSSSSLAVDGNEDVNFGDGSCTHTKSSGESNPWWRVDLQGKYVVSKVAIVNRGDCCWERLNGFQVTVGDSLYDNGNSNAVCVKAGSIGKGEKKEFFCADPLVGRYVNIMIPGDDKILTLCEVQIYGVSIVHQKELAHGKQTEQSSTDYGGHSSLAVDGRESSHFNDRSCTHTKNAGQCYPWWRVDLKARHVISKVVIVNRGDCCWDRMNGFQVTVGDSLVNNGNNNAICVKRGIIGKGEKKEFSCDKLLVGRYVNIMIPGEGKILTLCEVLVYGISW